MVAERWLVLGGVCDVDREAAFERVAAESPSSDRREQRIVGVAGAFGEPHAQDGGGHSGEWRDALFSAFPVAGDVAAPARLNVADVERCDLGGAQPGLDREHQQGVVASAGPGRAVRCGEQRIDLCFVEERDERSVGAFGWDREHALDVVGVLGVAQGGVSVERVDRRQPRVAGPGAVARVGLEVIEERGDRGRVEIGDVEHRRFSAAACGGERE